jgi:hypothetical protein
LAAKLRKFRVNESRINKFILPNARNLFKISRAEQNKSRLFFMPRWSNLSKGSANEWKNQIYLDFSRMQPTFTARSDVKSVQNIDKAKRKQIYLIY